MSMYMFVLKEKEFCMEMCLLNEVKGFFPIQINPEIIIQEIRKKFHSTKSIY